MVAGRLVTQFSFDARAVTKAQAETIADQTMANVSELVAHCLAVERVRYTPSDFSGVAIDQQGLDELLGDLDLSGLSDT